MWEQLLLRERSSSCAEAVVPCTGQIMDDKQLIQNPTPLQGEVITMVGL